MEKKGLTFIDFMLVLVAFLWGFNPVIMKIALRYMEVMPFNILRLGLSAVFSWIILYFTKTYKKVKPEDYKEIIIISLLGFFVFQLFYPMGVNMTTSGNAGLLLAFLPICVAIINKLFKIESISKQMAIGITISILGVAFVIVGGGNKLSFFDDYIFGSIITLIGVFGYGYYTVFSKKLSSKYSSYQIIAYTLSICTIAFIPISFNKLIVISWSEIPMSFWLACFYSGILSISVANTIWVWGVEKIGSTRTSVYNNFTPIFALVGGYLLLNETLKPLQFLGIPVVFLGLYLTRTNKKITILKKEIREKE